MKTMAERMQDALDMATPQKWGDLTACFHKCPFAAKDNTCLIGMMDAEDLGEGCVHGLFACHAKEAK